MSSNIFGNEYQKDATKQGEDENKNVGNEDQNQSPPLEEPKPKEPEADLDPASVLDADPAPVVESPQRDDEMRRTKGALNEERRRRRELEDRIKALEGKGSEKPVEKVDPNERPAEFLREGIENLTKTMTTWQERQENERRAEQENAQRTQFYQKVSDDVEVFKKQSNLTDKDLHNAALHLRTGVENFSGISVDSPEVLRKADEIGVDPEVIMENLWNARREQFFLEARQKGINPGKYIFDMAKRYGFNGQVQKAPDPKKKSLTERQKSMDRHSNFNRSAAPVDKKRPDDIMGMLTMPKKDYDQMKNDFYEEN